MIHSIIIIVSCHYVKNWTDKNVHHPGPSRPCRIKKVKGRIFWLPFIHMKLGQECKVLNNVLNVTDSDFKRWFLHQILRHILQGQTLHFLLSSCDWEWFQAPLFYLKCWEMLYELRSYIYSQDFRHPCHLPWECRYWGWDSLPCRPQEEVWGSSGDSELSARLHRMPLPLSPQAVVHPRAMDTVVKWRVSVQPNGICNCSG